MILLAALVVALAAAPLAGCSDDNDEPGIEMPSDNTFTPIALTRAQQDLVEASNDFAFNLFRAVTLPGKSGASPAGVAVSKSIVLSPLSITYALGMLNNGAAGQTQQQINNVLGYGDKGADAINTFCRKMLTEASTMDKLTNVSIANNIYMNTGYQLLPDFLSKAGQYYDAQPETRDFHDGKTRAVINRWASDHTEGMIKEVLSVDDFNADAVSYLLNAIYFRGIWQNKFNKSETKNETFSCGDGTQRQLPMMHQQHEFDYTENELCQTLSLPYGNGAYRMTLLLPREGKSVDEVLLSLNAQNWVQRHCIIRNTAIVDLKLPRFESQTDVTLNKVMAQLGMPYAFDRSRAEFPNFCNEPTYIGLMKQVARIKLDEAGTEAAAVTVVGVEFTALPVEPQHVTFHATRPFLYVVSEQSTGTIFFIGKYVGD